MDLWVRAAHRESAEVEAELERIGCLPSKDNPFLAFSLSDGGVAAVIYLKEMPDFRTAQALAKAIGG